MMSFSWLKNIRQIGSDPEAIRPFARFFWALLVFGTVFASIAILALGFYKFFNVEKMLRESASLSQIPEKELPFQKNDVQETLDLLLKRDAQYQLYVASTPSAADPSR